jgi:predicted nucleic acid-binding protein
MDVERIFADTNIWFYAFVRGKNLEDERKNEVAAQLIPNRPELSVQVVNELSVNLLKKAAYGEAQLQQLIQAIYQFHRVHPLMYQTLMYASRLRESYLFSYWDSLIVAAALENGCTMLYSEDMQHDQVIEQSLRIFNPFL